MIQISKENLFYMSRLFPILLVSSHVLMIVIIILGNNIVFYIMYSVLASVHFGIARIWRYFFLKDAFYENGRFLLKGLDGNEYQFDRKEVLSFRKSFGVTEFRVKKENYVLKYYSTIKPEVKLDLLL